MTFPGENCFLDSNYEARIFNSAEGVFTQWLEEEETTAEELEENLKEKTEKVIGRVLGAMSFSEEEITLFFEYIPDLYNHPVRVFGKPIKGTPDYKVLKEYMDFIDTGMTFPKPSVLLHDFGIYITCVTVPTRSISAEKLEQNMTILRGKAQETWSRILNPREFQGKRNE